MTRFISATEGHAHLVACNMREQDRAEIRDGWGMEPEAAIKDALSKSVFAQTICFKLEILAIYGLAPLSILGDTMQIWFFGTTAIDRHPVVFTRATVRGLKEIFSMTSRLTNRFDINDEKAKRWLDYIGARYLLLHNQRGSRIFDQFILERKQRCRLG